MKTKSYEQVTEQTIIAVKKYLLKHGKGYYQQDLHDIINRCIDIDQLKRKLNKRADLQLWLFTKFKKNLDHCSSYDEMEEHLVMMNLLIDRYYQPLLQYKYNLLYYIIDRQDLSLEIYCLLRHLIQFKYGKLEEFIKGITVYKNISEYEYHHIASEIFLLEKQYRRAYQHLPYVEYDQSLQRFENALYNYSPRQFFQLLNIDHQQVQLLSFR